MCFEAVIKEMLMKGLLESAKFNTVSVFFKVAQFAQDNPMVFTALVMLTQSSMGTGESVGRETPNHSYVRQTGNRVSDVATLILTRNLQ